MCFDIIQQFILVFRKTKNLGLIRISAFQRETPNRQVSVAGEVLELWQQLGQCSLGMATKFGQNQN